LHIGRALGLARYPETKPLISEPVGELIFCLTDRITSDKILPLKTSYPSF
jgi:hypothetical protein